MPATHWAESYRDPGAGHVSSKLVLHGRYVLGDMLGRGGLAEVRIGTDRRLGRTVAVKTLRVDLASDPICQARFRREAQSAAALNHPSIVAVYDTSEEIRNGRSVPYIVMEYVEGRTLRDLLRADRPILTEWALEIVADILDALEYSHRAGIVHRAISPANVMLTPSGDVKVMDFGIAWAVAHASATVTQTATVIGTPQYLSPEQARGESVDGRSDIFSTGCLLFELLSGQPPFVVDSPMSAADHHVREEPTPPSILRPAVTPHADAIASRALRPQPLDRYQSAAEMREDIELALAALPPVTAPLVIEDATVQFRLAGDASSVPMPHATGPAALWDGPEQDRGSERRRRIHDASWIVAILVVVGVAALLGLNALTRGGVAEGEGGTKPTPTLVGNTEDEARQILAAANLELGTIRHEASDTVNAGKITSQDPYPGDPVAVRGSVDITLSSGKKTVTVPDVAGKGVDTARAQLEAASFKVETKEDLSSPAEKGAVTTIDPTAGSQVPEGSSITIHYSSGLIEVPGVVGENASAAAARLDLAGFETHTIYEQTTQAPAGSIINQVPNAGTIRERGSTVIVVVATAP